VVGSAHDHDELLAAAAGDWRNTCKCAERWVVSLAEWPCRFPEQRRRHDHADPWHGLDDHDVALLVHLPLGRLLDEFLEDGLELGLAGSQLLVDEAHSLTEQLEMGDRRGRCAWCGEDRRAAQVLEDLLGIDSADAMLLQQLCDAGRLRSECCPVMRDQFKQARSPVKLPDTRRVAENLEGTGGGAGADVSILARSRACDSVLRLRLGFPSGAS
jgi:hypothetical protein